MTEQNLIFLNISKTELIELIKETVSLALSTKHEVETNTKELITIEDACKLFSCSRQDLYNKRKAGIIKGHKLKGTEGKRARTYFLRHELLASLL